MRRVASILLLLCFAALGTGALEWLHNQEHEREDAIQLAAARAAGLPDLPKPTHDDSNCAVHAQLHLLVMAAGWVPVLVSLGVLVAFLSLLDAPLVSQRTPLRIACRGPPLG